MTNEEAIKYLIKPFATSTEPGPEYLKQKEAYEMAIKALKERPQGEWLKDEEHSITIEMFKCSNCGYWGGADHFNFCPRCGARMGGYAE